MKDDAVSTVLATILLFGIVVLLAGTFALFAAEEITRKSESGPYVMFQESASPNYLYHVGGDSILKDEIRVYAKNYDITEKTTIEGKSWYIWQTGDALYLGNHKTSEITIVSRTSLGNEIILYEGLNNN